MEKSSLSRYAHPKNVRLFIGTRFPTPFPIYFSREEEAAGQPVHPR